MNRVPTERRDASGVDAAAASPAPDRRRLGPGADLPRHPLSYILVANALLHVWRYLGAVGSHGTGPGFNSDDAWIHLTFARNLARHFEFAHTAGVPSTGSTSPLWSVILAVPHLISENVDFIFGAVTVITVLLWLASAFMLHRLVRRLTASQWAAWLAAFLFVNEWHMIWAALSGMEIMLFICLQLVFLDRVLDEATPPGVLGGLGGFLFLTRPEGVLLLALGAAAAWVQRRHLGARAGWRAVVTMGLVALVVVSPALAFYLVVDGSLIPNTFHAKSNLYRVSELRGYYLPRFLRHVLDTLAGAHMRILAPWVLLAAASAVVTSISKRRLDPRLIVLGWMVLFLAAYAWKLPMGFQRGRYIMPVVPLVLGLGAAGLVSLRTAWSGRSLRSLPSRSRAARAAGTQALLRFVGPAVIVGAAASSLALFWLASGNTGVQAHVRDVLYINDQHVPVGRAIHETTPPGAVIATHDIGAVAYFGDRPVVDMIGLVTPALMPFCHRHRELKAILSGRHPLSASILGPYTRGTRDHVDYLALFTNPGAGFYEDFRFFDLASIDPRARARGDRDLRRVTAARFSLDTSPTGSVFTLYALVVDGAGGEGDDASRRGRAR